MVFASSLGFLSTLLLPSLCEEYRNLLRKGVNEDSFTQLYPELAVCRVESFDFTETDYDHVNPEKRISDCNG